MGNPDATTMKHWLKDVLEVEKGLIIVDSALADLTCRKDQLLTKRVFKEPKQPDEDNSMIGAVALLVPLERALVPAIVTGLVLLFFEPFKKLDGFDYIALCYVAWYLIMFFSVFVVSYRAADEAQIRYKRELAAYKSKKHDEVMRVMDIAQTVVPPINRQIRQLSKTKEQLLDMRRKLYATHYLAPKYQGIVPIATMLGYLESKRCTTIYGHGGIIDTYETDLRYAVIINKLDIIIERLEEIRDSQTELYYALRETNRMQTAIHTDIVKYGQQAIDDRAALIECNRYNTQILSYLSGIETYKMLK